MLGPWNQGTSRKLRKTRSACPLSIVTEQSGGSTNGTHVTSPKMRACGKSNSGLSFSTLLPGRLSEARKESDGTLPDAFDEPAPNHDESMSHTASAAAASSTERAEDETQDMDGSKTATHQVAPSWDLQSAIEQHIAPPLHREDSTHLDANLIRRATQCRSAMSGEESEMPDDPDVEGFIEENRWNRTHSTTPPILSRQHSQRTKRSQKGSTGTRYAHQESVRACVYSPSIYSRPASAEEERQQQSEGLNAMVVDWPLNNVEESHVDHAA
ncbi:hypothetical protein DOTSEDRAFT_75905, partial [Dothistroma septosporum NZE10]